MPNATEAMNDDHTSHQAEVFKIRLAQFIQSYKPGGASDPYCFEPQLFELIYSFADMRAAPLIKALADANALGCSKMPTVAFGTVKSEP